MHFLELLSGKKVPKYTEKPPSRIQKIENLHIALQFVEKEMGVRPTISAEGFFLKKNIEYNKNYRVC